MDINNNYDMYKYFIKTYIKREGVNEFLEWLDKSDAKIAPCSTKFHLSCEGGFIQHSLNVFSRLIKLCQNEYGDNCPYTQEQIALVSLLHDISKVNFYKFTTKNVKNEETNQWEKVPFIIVRDSSERFIYGTHSDNSLYITRSFFKLNYEEDIAIRYHMGMAEECNNNADVYNAHRASDLAFLLHTADAFATVLDEANDGNIEKGA